MNSLEKRRLAIVGGGAAGVAVFIEAVRHRVAKHIFVVDPAPIGQGLAFSHADSELICNTSADIMSVVSGAPLDFLDYLLTCGYPVTAETFVPRRVFGHYLAERFQQYRMLALACGIDVTHLRCRFTSLARIGNRHYRLAFNEPAGAEPLTATDVVFCTGTGPARVPDALAAYQSHPRFVSCPYDESELRRKVPADSRVLVVGSKLSAIDAAVLLCRANHRVTMMSPSGRLPAARARVTRGQGAPVDASRLRTALSHWDPHKASPSPVSLRWRYLRYFAREVRHCTTRSWRGQFSRAVRYGDRLKEEIALAETGQALWQDWAVNFVEVANSILLDQHEPSRYGFHPAFCQMLFDYVAAAALPNARKVAHYIDQGLLEIRQGTLGHVAADCHRTGTWQVDWGDGARRFDAVVNASGYHAPRYVLGDDGQLRIGIDRLTPGTPIDALQDLSLQLSPASRKDSIWLIGPALQGRVFTANAIFAITSLAERVVAAMRAQAIRPSAELGVQQPLRLATVTGAV